LALALALTLALALALALTLALAFALALALTLALALALALTLALARWKAPQPCQNHTTQGHGAFHFAHEHSGRELVQWRPPNGTQNVIKPNTFCKEIQKYSNDAPQTRHLGALV
jgi:hypothetical protein